MRLKNSTHMSKGSTCKEKSRKRLKIERTKVIGPLLMPNTHPDPDSQDREPPPVMPSNFERETVLGRTDQLGPLGSSQG